jgi:hypothetical protein
MRKFLLVAAVAIGVGVFAGFALFRRYTAAFPDLSPGVYVGVLQPSTSSHTAIPWLVARFPGEQSLAVSVGDVRFPAQRVAPVDPLGKTRQPLVVGESGVRLRLTGASDESGGYEGKYLNPITQEQGAWTLTKVRTEEPPLSTEQGLVRWFALWQEIERIELEIQGAQAKADQQRVSIDNLHRHVSDEEVLRKTADIRLGRSDSELEGARSELQLRQQQLDKVIRDFDLSQRISQEGKLVFLARETIQRESRWIELSLKLLAPETSLGFDQALARAERVQTLKRQIRREREAVVHKSTEERYRGTSKETQNEEEFYGQLQ